MTDDIVDELRALATFLEGQPLLRQRINEIPMVTRYWAWSRDADEFRRLNTGIGSFNKESTDTALTAVKKFGPHIELRHNVFRSEACERVVVGTKIEKRPVVTQEEVEVDDVQWVCPPEWKEHATMKGG